MAIDSRTRLNWATLRSASIKAQPNSVCCLRMQLRKQTEIRPSEGYQKAFPHTSQSAPTNLTSTRPIVDRDCAIQIGAREFSAIQAAFEAWWRYDLDEPQTVSK